MHQFQQETYAVKTRRAVAGGGPTTTPGFGCSPTKSNNPPVHSGHKMPQLFWVSQHMGGSMPQGSTFFCSLISTRAAQNLNVHPQTQDLNSNLEFL